MFHESYVRIAMARKSLNRRRELSGMLNLDLRNTLARYWCIQDEWVSMDREGKTKTNSGFSNVIMRKGRRNLVAGLVKV